MVFLTLMYFAIATILQLEFIVCLTPVTGVVGPPTLLLLQGAHCCREEEEEEEVVEGGGGEGGEEGEGGGEDGGHGAIHAVTCPRAGTVL